MCVYLLYTWHAHYIQLYTYFIRDIPILYTMGGLGAASAAAAVGSVAATKGGCGEAVAESMVEPIPRPSDGGRRAGQVREGRMCQ